MNPTHTAVLVALRLALAGSTGPDATDLIQLSETQIVRMMFLNYRGSGDTARGLRLTRYGLKLMCDHFQHYDIGHPEDRIITTREILYLDRKAAYPYFCDGAKLVMFDTDLGFRLKLVDGDIALLMQAEGD